MSKVKINNIHLYYELHGKGDPLLLIAGLGCDSQSWLPVVNELSKHFQIIVFDNRGVGRSNIPAVPYNICIWWMIL
ncbi:MAG: alpha/beta fold hydrolase [Candidatus Cloacimonetes bacterium]|nr:alpha/beta fold hydrolase [Candidatus Cloacimonadota bacterium]